MNEPPFALTDAERFSPVWLKLKAHLEQRLQTCRARNDGPLTLEETLTLRGRIACLREILALDKVLPKDSE